MKKYCKYAYLDKLWMFGRNLRVNYLTVPVIGTSKKPIQSCSSKVDATIPKHNTSKYLKPKTWIKNRLQHLERRLKRWKSCFHASQKTRISSRPCQGECKGDITVRCAGAPAPAHQQTLIFIHHRQLWHPTNVPTLSLIRAIQHKQQCTRLNHVSRRKWIWFLIHFLSILLFLMTV